MRLGFPFAVVTAVSSWYPGFYCNAECDVNAPQSYDGICNNVDNELWGAAHSFYRRGPEGAEYEDGVRARVTNRPMERVISNRLGEEDPATATEDPIKHNLMAVLFGQFIDHDVAQNDVVPFPLSDDMFITEPDDQFCFCDALCVLDPPSNIGRCTPDCLSGGPTCPSIPGEFITPGRYFLSGFRFSQGTISSGQFEVNNRLTSYLDLSMVYGNNHVDASHLREFTGGRLLTDDYDGTLSETWNFAAFSFQNFPPKKSTTGLDASVTGLPNPTPTDEEILTSGDNRINQNVALAAFHTLFLREHNQLAEDYANTNPSWTDEDIFQAARRRNIAQYQKIVLEDYFPAEFGEYFQNVVGAYQGYDSTLDATTGAVFAAAAFRYGHSSLRPYKPMGECGSTSTRVDFDLCEFTTLPTIACDNEELPFLGQTGSAMHNILAQVVASGPANGEDFEPIFRSLIGTRTRPIDSKMEDTIHHIYNPRPFPGPTFQLLGSDLLAIDLRRGRENGIPNYDRLRAVYHPDGSLYTSPGSGCGGTELAEEDVDDPVPCFLTLVSGQPSPGQASVDELELALALRELYGKVNRIDAWIGLMVEHKVPGSSFGETAGRIIADQYNRLRGGDRFWYENVLSASEQTQVRAVTMKTLLERNFQNFGNDQLPDQVFLSPDNFAQDLASACNFNSPSRSKSKRSKSSKKSKSSSSKR